MTLFKTFKSKIKKSELSIYPNWISVTLHKLKTQICENCNFEIIWTFFVIWGLNICKYYTCTMYTHYAHNKLAQHVHTLYKS